MPKINKIPNVSNVGYIDSLFRLGIGIAALSPVMLQQTYSPAINSILALISIYPILTSILRWDPFYELLDIRSTRETVKSEQSIEDFLERSRLYLRALATTSHVSHVSHVPGSASNEIEKPRKTA